MHYYPSSIRKLIRNIARLPGIGEKTAERLTMHLLKAPRAEVETLADSILELRQRVRLCSRCFGLSDGELCEVCRNPARDGSLLCVVEQPADMVSIEKSGSFTGIYFILGGVILPMNGIGPEEIRIPELVRRVEKPTVTEVVLATSTTVEGESTAAFIAEQLDGREIRVTRIASGVPIGGDLKYVDPVTLKRALEGRRAVE